MGTKRPVVAGPVDLRELIGPLPKGEHIELTDEQGGCLTGLVQSRNAVNMVDAGQGTGKTTFLEYYGRILKRCKVRATWLGTTNTAVDELKARGLPAMTLAHFLHSPEAQRKAAGSRIVLDESSMLAHRDTYDLSRYAKCRIASSISSATRSNTSRRRPGIRWACSSASPASRR